MDRIDEKVHTADLLDIYMQLLTVRQQDILQSYFGEDLSLAEIAEQKGISRQAVLDSIKRGKNILEDAEKKLLLLEKSRKSEAVLENVFEKLKRIKPDPESMADYESLLSDISILIEASEEKYGF